MVLAEIHTVYARIFEFPKFRPALQLCEMRKPRPFVEFVGQRRANRQAPTTGDRYLQICIIRNGTTVLNWDIDQELACKSRGRCK
jgi:hypothetical protein